MLETLIAQIINTFESEKISNEVYTIKENNEKYVLISCTNEQGTDMLVISKMAG